MKIIIPMTGLGQRFVDAGYKTIKPLILVEDKPIIEHVINLFPDENDIVFICNTNHLRETNLRKELLNLVPNARIIEIPLHKKGPVYAVDQIKNIINDDEEVIINYCDFGTYWDYKDFLKHTRARNADGAIVAYKGFHPHMLGNINYAFIRDNKQWMLEIKEKEPFTENRMNEYASNGTYYFKKGSYVKKYFKQLMNRDINTNGEYYVSMVYNLMAEDSLKISIYEIQHMQQWGTPGELEEYQYWSDCFKSLIKNKINDKKYNSIKLIPMAGKGQRYVDAGYNKPKPLIEISGKPMFVQASNALPQCSKNIFVCLDSHIKDFALDNIVDKHFDNVKIINIDETTLGQACTCEVGLKNLSEEELNLPLFIGACDNSMLYDYEKLDKEISNCDILAFSFRNNPASKKKPTAYGWLKLDERKFVTDVSVKIPISDNPQNDHAIVGAFYFKTCKIFLECLNYLYKNDIRVNNEFYVDSCVLAGVKLGYKVKPFEVDRYICWGTPDDYETFCYYQSLFHKLTYHPYSLEKDTMIDEQKIEILDKTFRTFNQKYQ